MKRQSMCARRAGMAVLAAVLGVVLPLPAAATALAGYASNCSVGNTVDTFGNEDWPTALVHVCNHGNGDFVTPPFSEAAWLSLPTSSQGDTAGAYAVAVDYGRLGIRLDVAATAQQTAATQNFVPKSFSTAGGNLFMADSFVPTAISGVLAPGTPVAFTAVLRLHGVELLPVAPSGSATVQNNLLVELFLDNDPVVYQITHATDGQAVGPFDETLLIQGTAFAGQAFQFSMYFWMNAQAKAEVASGTGTEWSGVSYGADLLSELSFTVADANVRLVSESGHDYRLAAAVAEPATMLMAAAALLGLVALRRRAQPNAKSLPGAAANSARV